MSPVDDSHAAQRASLVGTPRKQPYPRCPGHLLAQLFLSFGFVHRIAPQVLAKGRDHRFDGEKQSSATFWVFDEFRASHVEAHRRIVLGMNQHCPDADAP